MESIRVLVAEDNHLQRDKLVAALRQQEGIQVVGAAENGIEALHMVKEHHPAVLVCDMVMPQMDGFALLECISQMLPHLRPKVITLTALSRDDFITRAISLGASFYMVKPVDMTLLVQRIRQLAEQPVDALANLDSSAPLDDMVTSLLLQLGMPAHIHGYHFIRKAVMLVSTQPEFLSGITRSLYPAIAQSFHTTPSRVERSIRHAISITWERGGGTALWKIMDRSVYTQQDRPSNCELIALLSERIRYRNNWRR